LRLEYKWTALINTTIGMLMASINQTIVLISLPAIFSGLHVDPLGAGQSSLLLWMMLGFPAVTTVLLVTAGRIADTVGRVRVYNLGFVLFTLASLLCAITPSLGTTGAIELIGFRMVQGLGAACLFSTSVAILTDAFPVSQRGMSIGVNQLAFIGGNVIGVVLGGLLAAINWRLDFLISVPVGVLGSVWAYRRLREIGQRHAEPPDWLGNLTFAGGLLALMLGLTEALSPYGGQGLGWSNPATISALAVGVILLGAFLWTETRVTYPMFQLALFKARGFLFGNLAALLFSLARGGVQFMLIIWLQGIWLPLHGVSYADTPLKAGLATMPMMVGFVVCGPIGGWLSDRHGARVLSTAGVGIAALGAAGLLTLPVDFALPGFVVCLLLLGAGMGLFSAPNTAQIMSAVPAAHRGAASGMRATIWNAGITISQAVFFTILISGLSQGLAPALQAGVSRAGLSPTVAAQMAGLPAGSAIFAAILGYDPISHLIGPAALAGLPPAAAAHLVDPRFFAGVLAEPFVEAVRIAFAVCVALSVVAGAASLMRGSSDRRRDAEPAPASARGSEAEVRAVAGVAGE
jgi:MFS family permease